jgi:hypothetical protein
MSDRPSEERAIDIACLFAGTLPLVASLVKGGSIGIGLSICILMTLVGAIGLISDAWRSRRRALPTARTVDRSSTAQTR